MTLTVAVLLLGFGLAVLNTGASGVLHTATEIVVSFAASTALDENGMGGPPGTSSVACPEARTEWKDVRRPTSSGGMAREAFTDLVP